MQQLRERGAGALGRGSGTAGSPCTRAPAVPGAEPSSRQGRTAAAAMALSPAQRARATGTPARVPTQPHRAEPSASAPKKERW